MKALVVSGGGSKGAFGGGVAQHLIENEGKEYDLYIGTSTGSLLVPFLAVKKIDKLKEAYTNVTQKDIFKVNPFKIKEQKNGAVKVGINYWNVIKNVIFKKKKAFGDASNLRDLISKFMTERDYDIIRKSGKEVIACVTNLTLAQAEYKSTADYGWRDYGDYMLASATVPPFMEPVEKEGYHFADGGIVEHAPIQEAIDRGATEIDVIILRKEVQEIAPEMIRNPFHYIFRTVDIMMTEIGRDDVRLANLKAKQEEVTINFYYTPRKLTNNSLVFNKEVMTEWWNEGYEYACKKECKSYQMVKGRKAKLIKDVVKKSTKGKS